MTESTNPQTMAEATRQIQELRRELENLKAEMKPINALRLPLNLLIQDLIFDLECYIRSERGAFK